MGGGEGAKGREKKKKEQNDSHLVALERSRLAAESDITIISCWTEKNQLTLL